MREVLRAFAEVRYRIAAACARSHRDPSGVVLVAVTKTVPPDRIREALAAGQHVFGENRVQEALAKIPEVGTEARWQLVGRLQKNKVRHAVGVFELIHSLDGPELATEIDKRARAAGLVQEALVQVNLSRETTKGGVSEEEAARLLETVASLPGLKVRGLMTIPPPVDDPEASRPWYVRLRGLRDDLAARTGLDLPELSMGMTDDFEVAVEEGATLVRVGRALFGERAS